MKFLSRFGLRWSVALLVCGMLVTSCAQAPPPEPAPEFTLPLSQVSTAPPSPGEAAATAAAPSTLRYVAVPPGHNVAGMAHARIVVKHKRATRHRHTHKAGVARGAAVKKPAETTEPVAKP